MARYFIFISVASDINIDKNAGIGNFYLLDLSETLFLQKDAQIGNLEAMEREKEATLNHIYNSHGWKALIVYYKLREKIFPVNSRRRKAAKFVRNFTWKICGRWRQIGTKAVDAIRSILEGPPLKGKNRMLVIDRFVPTYDKDSGSLRMYSFLKILKELDYRITLLPDDLQKRKPYVDDLQKIGIEVLYGNLDVEKYLGRMGALFTFVILSRPEQVFKYISLIRAYAINSIVIYDTVDLHWLRFERAAAVSGDKELLNKARYFKSMELFNASCSDIVFTITKDEKEFLLKELPNLKIEVIPNIHGVIKEVKPFETRKDIMFIGGFLHHPNEDGVFFFVKEIFPRVKEKIPDIKFFIVGSDPSDAISKLDSNNIKVTGYVRDVTPYFENCRIFVSPLRFGAGMKGKIGQSMAYGLPVVTTTVGAEGIGLVDGENALIADEPGQFSNSIIRLYTEKNLWDKISSKSIEHIRSNYSQEVIAPKIAELFNSINFQGR